MSKTRSYITILVLVVSAVSFLPAFADTQVIIPLGASNSANPFSLSPAVLDVKVNETVSWQNQDTGIHSVTTGKPQLGYDGRVDSGVIQAGQTFSYKFTKAGVYQYFCLFHPWMTGLVNVGDGTSVDPEIQISISTDRPSYNRGDMIQVSGQVSRFIQNEQITVWIADQKGKGIVINHIETEDGAKFSTSIPAGGSLWQAGNSYKVFAQYGSRSSVAWADITFEPELKADDKNYNIQGTGNSGTTTSLVGVTSYMSSHKKIIADSNEFVTVQTDNHIYRPGQQVKISGTIWGGMLQYLGGAKFLLTVQVSGEAGNSMAELVRVQVTDTTGNIILDQPVQVDGNGEYSIILNLPQTAVNGAYKVGAAVETKQGLLNALDASVSTKMQTLTKFVVANPSQFPVKTASGDFKIELESNSTVSGLEFKPDQKKVSFVVQGETGTKGVTLITIPKSVLSGNLQVIIDGNAQAYGSDDVIVSSETSDQTTLEINYHHSTHTIEIVGTQAAELPKSSAVPEFSSMVPIVLAVSVVSIMVLPMKTRAGLKLFHRD